jgi:tRNA A37 threonylcarbamoyltransferase TsaD
MAIGGSVAKLLILLSILLLVGCVSSPSISTAEFDARVRTTFPGTGASAFWVSSGGAIADPGRISLLSVNTATAHQGLVLLIQNARRDKVRLVVSGANSSLARQELLAALSRVDGSVPMLELAFIGEASDAAIVQTAVEKVGGKYVNAK